MPKTLHRYHEYAEMSDFEWSFKSLRRQSRSRHLYVGVELEIDRSISDDDDAPRDAEEDALEITTAGGFPSNESYDLIAALDGSLNCGIEIISQPATLEYHLKKYGWKKLMEKAVENYSSHSIGTCGLHFHVDRRYFEDAMVNPKENLMVLVLNNAEWLKRFSRRDDFSYCRFPVAQHFPASGGQFKTAVAPLLLSEIRYNIQHSSHYSALNLCNNATIEFRFCRGTLVYTTFLASLQLICMMCYAAKKFRIEQCANTRLNWFLQRAKTLGYKEFLDYCAHRNIFAVN